MRNVKIQAAVGAVLGLAGLGFGAVAQAGPSLSNCDTWDQAAATRKLYVAGSSAAQGGFSIAIANDLFGGVSGETLFNGTNTSGNSVTNFQAYCGTAVAGNQFGIPANANVIIYYRAEGGSVTGALPIVASKQINQLSIHGAAALIGTLVPGSATVPDTYPVNIAGTSSANGPNDSFGPAGLQKKFVDIGITDVEPGILGGVNYPTTYNATVYGTASAAQLAGLNKTLAFSQAFGFFINPTGLTAPTLDFSTDTMRAIFNGGYTNWNQVTTTSGVPATTGNVPIKIVNREEGSGTRASTGIFLYNYGCGGSAGMKATFDGVDSYATKEALVKVGANTGAITYAGIDNAGKVTNANLIGLNGLNGANLTNLQAATGSYPFQFEANYIKNPAALALNGNTGQDSNGTATAVTNAIFNNGTLINIATAPHGAQTGAIAFAGTNDGADGNVAGTANTVAGKTIYINAFSRNGNSCSALSPQ